VASDRGEIYVHALADSSRQTLPLDAYHRVMRKMPRVEAEAVLARDAAREEEARRVFVTMVRRHRLDMHLSAIEISRSDSRILFYFTSPGRVDFRGLVRDLASALRSRIELRQIGVRDESRCTGGLGPCGMPLCCATHLRDFTAVTIRMAKTQGLVLNPQKVSGVCGRLMCCLAYEHEVYTEMKKAFPKTGTIVVTPQGEGKIKEHLIMRQAVRVAIGPGQFVDIPLKDLVFKQAPELQAPESEEPEEGEDSDVV
jgi:cell fate regulator YaaT (PSP1 superfamily)